MPKLLKTTIAILGAALIAVPAFAGETQPAEVNVDLDNFFVGGDLVAARTDADDEVFLGCGTRNIDDGAGGLFSWAFCQARDAEGDQVTCFAFDSPLVDTIKAINDTSYVTFSWTDDGAGNLECTRMGFSTQSFYLGKEIKGNKEGKKN